MKHFYLILSLLTGCTTSVKLTEVKIRPSSHPLEKIVDINFRVQNAYEYSCQQNGALFQLQDGRWKEIKNEFDPNDSGTPFILDGKFSPATRWGEGCDVVSCEKAFPSIGFHLTEYKEVEKQLNPEFKVKSEENGWSNPKIISVYKTNFISGHLKARYDYYTDSECKHKESQEIEFEAP